MNKMKLKNCNQKFNFKKFSMKFIKYAIISLFIILMAALIFLEFIPFSLYLKIFSILLIVTCISLGISALYVLKKPPHTCDENFFDPWSLPHYLVPLDFSMILYLYLKCLFLSIFIPILADIIYEFIELLITKINYNFGAESLKNKVSDVFFACCGSLTNLFLIFLI